MTLKIIEKSVFKKATRKNPAGHKAYSRMTPKGKVSQIKEKPYIKEESEEYRNAAPAGLLVAPLVQSKLITPEEGKMLVENVSRLVPEAQTPEVRGVIDNLQKGQIAHGFDKAGFRTVANFDKILKKYDLTSHEVFVYKGDENRTDTAINVWSNADVKLITYGDPHLRGGYSHYIGIEGKKDIADKIFNDIKKINDFEEAEWGTSGYIGSPSEEDITSGAIVKIETAK